MLRPLLGTVRLSKFRRTTISANKTLPCSIIGNNNMQCAGCDILGPLMYPARPSQSGFSVEENEWATRIFPLSWSTPGTSSPSSGGCRFARLLIRGHEVESRFRHVVLAAQQTTGAGRHHSTTVLTQRIRRRISIYAQSATLRWTSCFKCTRW